MRSTIFFIALATATSGCKSIDCGPGTVEQNGTCQPADVVTGNAMCGSGTMLDGDRCVPVYPPTLCDPGTTMEQPDPNDPSITLCVGNGQNGGCDGVFSCPTPAAGKQTICGQLYDITTNTKFQTTNTTPMGKPCQPGSTDGPCALAVTPYDAIAFGQDPSTAQPLASGTTYIDDCGRYRLTDVAQPSSPYIGLGFDDANAANMGPGGVTNASGVAVNASADTATTGVEAWVAPKATTDMWTASGGPPVSGGIYVAIFRTHKCPATGACDTTTQQAGVTITKSGATVPNNDYYFMAAETGHTMIDAAATATGANGTGLLTNASVVNDPPLAYSGTGGITDTTSCKWENHSAASLPNIVFFQVFRPQNQPGHQCAQ